MEKKCAFCGLNEDQIEMLIAAPGIDGTYICNECIELCMEKWKDSQQYKDIHNIIQD